MMYVFILVLLNLTFLTNLTNAYNMIPSPIMGMHTRINASIDANERMDSLTREFNRKLDTMDEFKNYQYQRLSQFAFEINESIKRQNEENEKFRISIQVAVNSHLKEFGSAIAKSQSLLLHQVYEKLDAFEKRNHLNQTVEAYAEINFFLKTMIHESKEFSIDIRKSIHSLQASRLDTQIMIKPMSSDIERLTHIVQSLLEETQQLRARCNLLESESESQNQKRDIKNPVIWAQTHILKDAQPQLEAEPEQEKKSNKKRKV